MVVHKAIHRVFCISAVCLAALPAAAGELPKLDSEAFCASVGEQSVMVRSACMNLQNDSYQKLLAIKDKITPEISESCMSSASSVSERRGYSGASYSSYYGCVKVAVRMLE